MSRFDLLGQSKNELPQRPDSGILETFGNVRPGRCFWIDLDCQEFSSLCPVTGQPDSARLRIRYVPGERCVETKSLKFYLASFRNQAAFNEEVVNQIFDDLVAVCAPRCLEVTGSFGARGGIQLTVVARHPDGWAGGEEMPTGV